MNGGIHCLRGPGQLDLAMLKNNNVESHCRNKLYFLLAEEEISGKCFLTHCWDLIVGPRGHILRHMLSVVCQLLVCCLPLLTNISEPQFPPNASFELITSTLLVRYFSLRL